MQFTKRGSVTTLRADRSRKPRYAVRNVRTGEQGARTIRSAIDTDTGRMEIVDAGYRSIPAGDEASRSSTLDEGTLRRDYLRSGRPLRVSTGDRVAIRNQRVSTVGTRCSDGPLDCECDPPPLRSCRAFRSANVLRPNYRAPVEHRPNDPSDESRAEQVDAA